MAGCAEAPIRIVRYTQSTPPGLRAAVSAGGCWEKLSMSQSKEHIHLRLRAVVIASRLPDKTAEALLVLDYARHLVVEFLDDSSGGLR